MRKNCRTFGNRNWITLFSTPDCVILTPIFNMSTSCDIYSLPTKDFVIYCFGWFAIIFLGFVITFILGLALYNLFRKSVEFFLKFYSICTMVKTNISFIFFFIVVCLRDICPQLKWEYDDRRSEAALLRYERAKRAAAAAAAAAREQEQPDPQAESSNPPRASSSSSYGACDGVDDI